MSLYQIDALKLLIAESKIARSKFTAKQQHYLDNLANQTGFIKSEKQGKGFIYQVINELALSLYLKQLQPKELSELNTDLPLRSKNIALYKNSKQGTSNHQVYYLLIKAVVNDVYWFNTEYSINISEQTKAQGVAALMIEPSDTWKTQDDLLLVENQELFNYLDWLPKDFKGSVVYYSGNLPNIFLTWLSNRPRAKRIILLADYDGVGLNNFLRLYKAVFHHQTCEFYLIPDWQNKLTTYGNADIWLKNKEKFYNAVQGLEQYMVVNKELNALIQLMQSLGKGLEQEAIWLS